MPTFDIPSSVCHKTGLRIVAGGGQSVFRVAKKAYGPLNPPVRSGRERRDWSRWDTPGRTVYGGATEKCAFMKCWPTWPDPPAVDLAELFDDVDDADAQTFAEQVRRELPGCGGMQDRSLSRGWRDARRLYELGLPDADWFIDIAAAESVTVLNREFGHALGGNNVTTSELSASSDEAKALTTAIATWVRDHVVLFDGSSPHGIVYPSSGAVI